MYGDETAKQALENAKAKAEQILSH
jgi:hypothetical protein